MVAVLAAASTAIVNANRPVIVPHGTWERVGDYYGQWIVIMDPGNYGCRWVNWGSPVTTGVAEVNQEGRAWIPLGPEGVWSASCRLSPSWSVQWYMRGPGKDSPGSVYIVQEDCATKGTLHWEWKEDVNASTRVLLVGQETRVVSPISNRFQVPVEAGSIARVFWDDLGESMAIEVPSYRCTPAEVQMLPSLANPEPIWLVLAYALILCLFSYAITQGYMHQYPKVSILIMSGMMPFHLALVRNIKPDGYFLAVFLSICFMVSRPAFTLGKNLVAFGHPRNWLSWPSREDTVNASIAIMFAFLLLINSFMLVR